jgi:predicted nucleic acid-binding protein
MPPTRVVSDTSFYICFLDDIQRVDALLRLLTCEWYGFVMGAIIRREVTAKECPMEFLKALDTHVERYEYYNYGEILRPFFGDSEIERGESEAVVISFILHTRGEYHRLIIDESPARRFIERTHPDLLRYLTGTVGFVESATVARNVFTPEEAIEILRSISSSRFRIDPGMVQEAIERLEGT